MEEQAQTLADKAYAILEEMIVTLQLQPGSVLSETQLSKRIHIGRTPMREGLQRLATEGLVASLPRRGIVVSEINVSQHLALLETRRVLDRLVVQRAAKRGTQAHREQLESSAQAMQGAATANDLARFMHLDREFDQIVETASRNAYAARALAPLHAHCRRFWYMYHHNGDLLHSANLHTRIMEEIVRGDEEAAGSASDSLLDYLEQFTRTAFDI
jgi:DNA-binding GntR family transcriptional regulator